MNLNLELFAFHIFEFFTVPVGMWQAEKYQGKFMQFIVYAKAGGVLPFGCPYALYKEHRQQTRNALKHLGYISMKALIVLQE